MINRDNIVQVNAPWKHFTFNNMFTDFERIVEFSEQVLPNVSDITVNPIKYNHKRELNVLADNNHSCEVDIDYQLTQKYSVANKLIEYFSREGKNWLEQIGNITLPASTLLRVQLIRDLNGYYIKPHTDKSNKIVTIICHLTEIPNGGTQILDKNQKTIYRVESKKNNGLLFFPNYAPYVKTYHAFMDTEIKGVRDTLMINYYSSSNVKTEYLWKL